MIRAGIEPGPAQRARPQRPHLHTDHLGSISVVTSSTGGIVSQQRFDPWGKVIYTNGQTPTKLNYTGQRKDDTALLYYHARYYDPVLGRFVSPDSIVPGATSGTGGAADIVGIWQSSKLTVDFHETGFVSSTNAENQLILQKGYWFQLDKADQAKVDISGPYNPQALNRFSYVTNNPLRYIDPTGHDLRCHTYGCGGVVINNSSYPVVVTGDYYDPSCKCDKYGPVTIPPGKSSKDMNMYDADFVSAADDQHPIDGHNSEWDYKLVDGYQVEVRDDGHGGQTLNASVKPGENPIWWWAISIARGQGWQHTRPKPCGVPGGSPCPSPAPTPAPPPWATPPPGSYHPR